MDSAETIFIKRVLQHGLREDLRNELAQNLFDRFVGVDPAAFAAELYMTPEQLRIMIRCGMYVGSHGAKHYWLDRLDAPSQTREIDESLDTLVPLATPKNGLFFFNPKLTISDRLNPSVSIGLGYRHLFPPTTTPGCLRFWACYFRFGTSPTFGLCVKIEKTDCVSRTNFQTLSIHTILNVRMHILFDLQPNFIMKFFVVRNNFINFE